MSKVIKTKTKALADARAYKKAYASKNKSQKEMALEYMTLYGSITPREALDAFGCFRLGARISELREDGESILSITKGSDANYATYVLEGEL